MTELSPSRRAVVAKARSLLGTKWRHRGRTERAIDCLGLIVLSLNAGGIEARDRSDYGREPWNEGLQKTLREHFGDPVPEAQWQPGDVALFDLTGNGPGHVGILADYRHGGLSIIHCHSFFNVTEHALTGKWRQKLVEVYSCER